jgi:hypothetical protein
LRRPASKVFGRFAGAKDFLNLAGPHLEDEACPAEEFLSAR